MDNDLNAVNLSTGTAPAAPDPMIGYVLDGRYQLLQAIGSGGMSIVYQARLNTVGKMVAIKTLNIQVQAKENVRERFYREIELLLKLEHPHIVSVQDCVLGPNNQPYLVMDLLRGVSLEQELAKCGMLPPGRVRKIMIQVCAAVKYAHQHSVVHRDLKPGNIMLLENEVDFVKVLDFGLSLIGENNHKITQSGEFWGSPPYASPEQVKGDEVDHRSDIYSLGCVMYELLSGKDPFAGAGLFELLSKHVNEQPEPISVTNPNVVVPAELERIVFKCMAKHPSDRFQSVAELQAALETIGSGSNSIANSSVKFHIPHAPPRSFKIPIIVASILVLSAGFLFVFMTVQKTKTAAAADDAFVVDNPHSSKPATQASNTEASHTHRSAAPAHLAKVQKKSAVKHEAKPAGQSSGSGGDPFARLRNHLSTGAKDD